MPFVETLASFLKASEYALLSAAASFDRPLTASMSEPFSSSVRASASCARALPGEATIPMSVGSYFPMASALMSIWTNFEFAPMNCPG